jgi:hypothetical protein
MIKLSIGVKKATGREFSAASHTTHHAFTPLMHEHHREGKEDHGM